MPQQRLAALAEEIVTRRLSAPAIFLLELSKPLCGLAEAAGQVSLPILAALVGQGRSQELLNFLSSRDNIERLICLIEDRQSAPKEAVHGN